jgi:hypothetical protein
MLFGVGLQARQEVGEPAWGAHAEEDEGLAESLRTTLGEETYARVLASGQKMSLDDALEAALRFTSACAGRTPDQASPSAPTRRTASID